MPHIVDWSSAYRVLEFDVDPSKQSLGVRSTEGVQVDEREVRVHHISEADSANGVVELMVHVAAVRCR